MSKLRKGDESATSQETALRRRAEALAVYMEPQDLESFSPEEMRQVLHELRVHQIELTMQNEELRRAQVQIDAARERYFDLYNMAPVGYCTVSEKGLILEANLIAASMLGVARGELVRQPISRFILREDQDIYYLHRRKLLESGEPHVCELRMVERNGLQFWARLRSLAMHDPDGALVSRVVMNDITERKQVEQALREKAEELRQALEQIKTLRGIVPICASCKNIRDDQGYWSQVEVYVRDRTGAEFSHSLCPECVKKIYPEYAQGGGEETG
jgi:PAS domain S-box-containing protein